jgi:hypothetical protein
VRRFLSAVPSTRIRQGVRAGLIASAATAGAVIGFGLRHHDWTGPFATLGFDVLQPLGVTGTPQFVPFLVGAAMHVAWMTVWGLAFATFAYRRPSAISALIALMVGFVATLAARTVIPAAMGAVRYAAMPSVQAALCVGLMTAGLLYGRALTSTD